MIKKILKILIVVLIIIAAAAFGLHACNKSSKDNKNADVDTELFYNSELFSDDEAIEERLSGEESDIEGWTKLDKQNAGLSTLDGSDSDHDGLTDKEEIEVYGSDPTKTSTSGDLYSDGYKVENGLDINTSYDDSFVTYYYDIPNGVTLHSEDAIDNIATVKPYSTGDTGAYAACYVTNYSGKSIDINVSGICSKNGLKDSQIGCYICDKGDCNSSIYCDYKVKDGILTLENEFSFHDGYVIYITDKKSIPSAAERFLFGDDVDISSSSAEEVDTEEGLMVEYFAIAHLFDDGLTPTVYYYDTGDETKNNNIVKGLKEAAENELGNISGVKLKPVSLKEIRSRYNAFENLCEGSFNGKDESALCGAILYYRLLSEYEASLPKPPTNSGTYNGTGFDIVEDTLPFPNFSDSKYGKGGNCMGIATLIAKVANTGTNPSSGICENSSKIYENDILTWDISIDEENDTLTDSGLSDYKTYDFKKNHLDSDGKINKELLSDGEKEFVKMINSYFVDGNHMASWYCPWIYQDSYTGYNLSNLVKVCEENLGNKVLTIGLGEWNGEYDDKGLKITRGHAMNIYGITHDVEGEEEKYILDVYDNNLPGERSEGLKIEIIPKSYNTFDFAYNGGIFDGEEYKYSSYDVPGYKLVIMDEDQNILFGTDEDMQKQIRPATEEELEEYYQKKEEEENRCDWFDWLDLE